MLVWSNRLFDMFVSADYAVDKPIPNWVWVAAKRHRSVYWRWYGL